VISVRYAPSPCIKQSRFVFKGLITNVTRELLGTLNFKKWTVTGTVYQDALCEGCKASAQMTGGVIGPLFDFLDFTGSIFIQGGEFSGDLIHYV
jgi:hypothetical protein